MVGFFLVKQLASTKQNVEVARATDAELGNFFQIYCNITL